MLFPEVDARRAVKSRGYRIMTEEESHHRRHRPVLSAQFPYVPTAGRPIGLCRTPVDKSQTPLNCRTCLISLLCTRERGHTFETLHSIRYDKDILKRVEIRRDNYSGNRDYLFFFLFTARKNFQKASFFSLAREFSNLNRNTLLLRA